MPLIVTNAMRDPFFHSNSYKTVIEKRNTEVNRLELLAILTPFIKHITLKYFLSAEFQTAIGNSFLLYSQIWKSGII